MLGIIYINQEREENEKISIIRSHLFNYGGICKESVGRKIRSADINHVSRSERGCQLSRYIIKEIESQL
jgi:hypothetical protein